MIQSSSENCPNSALASEYLTIKAEQLLFDHVVLNQRHD